MTGITPVVQAWTIRQHFQQLCLAAGQLSQLVLLMPDGQDVSTVQVYQLDGQVIFMLSNLKNRIKQELNYTIS